MAGKRKLLAICGAVAAVGAAALLKRDKVAALLPSRTGGEAPPAPAPPQQTNYDAPGPVANTATPVPAPDSHETPPPAIDEAAEEAAAAAEAGAIGGTVERVRGPGRRAGRRGRPPARRGRRGRVRGRGAGRGGPRGERRVPRRRPERRRAPDRGDDRGRRPAADRRDARHGRRGPGHVPPARAARRTPTDETAPDVVGGGISGRPNAGLPTDNADAGEGDGPTSASQEGEGGDDADDWRTWSGRSVKP